jgi:hypothetical protein
METEEKEKDPFAGLKDLLYRQKPETREAEIRAEKNRAKATAFLQAFGTIADAFTLSRGGDVPKRDLNPYIMNNMRRADTLREQDRADKKAWENSLLNLENNVAQYNARQQEILRQREWMLEDRTDAENKELQRMDYTEELARRRREDEDIKRGNIEKYKATIARENDLDRFLRQIELEGLRHANNMNLYALQKGTKGTKGTKGISETSGTNPKIGSGKTYMSIPDPNDPAKMVDIDESVAHRIFGLAQNARHPLIPRKRTGGYTADEEKRAIEIIAAEDPGAILKYLGELGDTVLGQQGQTQQYGQGEGTNAVDIEINSW